MATIDLTLNSIQIPAISGYTPPFGTKKASDGLTTQEVNDNVIAPFVKERPVVITENSTTGNVEYNASIVLNSADVVFGLGSGTFVGCEVKVIAATAGTVSYNSGTTDILSAGQIVTYIWNGSVWVSDITITGKTIAYADNTMTGIQPTLTAGTGIDITGTTISAKLDFVVDGAEVKTGETYGGKPVYCKAISFTFNANGSEATKAHGISNISKIIKIDGWVYSSIGRYMALNDPFNYMVVSTTTMFYAPNSYASLNGCSGVAFIYYTKTTD